MHCPSRSGPQHSVCVCAKSLQSCLTRWDPTGCSPPGSSVHGILQARILECVAMPSSVKSCVAWKLWGQGWLSDADLISMVLSFLCHPFLGEGRASPRMWVEVSFHPFSFFSCLIFWFLPWIPRVCSYRLGDFVAPAALERKKLKLTRPLVPPNHSLSQKGPVSFCSKALEEISQGMNSQWMVSHWWQLDVLILLGDLPFQRRWQGMAIA